MGIEIRFLILQFLEIISLLVYPLYLQDPNAHALQSADFSSGAGG